MSPQSPDDDGDDNDDDDDDDDGDDDSGDDSGDGDNEDGDDDGGYLLAPASKIHLDPDTLLLPPANDLKSVSEREACSQWTNTGDGTQQTTGEMCDKYGPICRTNTGGARI